MTGKTLNEIAEDLIKCKKKVQLIYAFNGTGKTQLSRKFKELITSGNSNQELTRQKILYYNAFTEDLFHWDNDLDENKEFVLNIKPNLFTNWVIGERGQDSNIITFFQNYTSKNLHPSFVEENEIIKSNKKSFKKKFYPKVSFSFKNGSQIIENIKISKGEESNFIWSIFYALLNEVISTLNDENNEFNDLEYVFIDDPVSSLDENYLIQLAVDISTLIVSCKNERLQFIITTHNTLFYNVLFNQFKQSTFKENKNSYNPKKHFIRYTLNKRLDQTFDLIQNSKTSSFSYHLLLLSKIQEAINNDTIERYHFNFLRNLLEKMCLFLGLDHWRALLPKNNTDEKNDYLYRIINYYSHSDCIDENFFVNPEDKENLKDLTNHLIENYHFWKQE